MFSVFSVLNVFRALFVVIYTFVCSPVFLGDPRDIDATDQFGRTALIFCVLADRQECLDLLLRAGAAVNRKDRGGRTALHWAAHKV